MSDQVPTEHPEGDAIRKRVERYFSDENLPHDAYMLALTRGSENWPVSVSRISGFYKMRQYKPHSQVKESLRKSTFLEFTDSKHIRRRVPLAIKPTVTLEAIDEMKRLQLLEKQSGYSQSKPRKQDKQDKQDSKAIPHMTKGMVSEYVLNFNSTLTFLLIILSYQSPRSTSSYQPLTHTAPAYTTVPVPLHTYLTTSSLSPPALKITSRMRLSLPLNTPSIEIFTTHPSPFLQESRPPSSDTEQEESSTLILPRSSASSSPSEASTLHRNSTYRVSRLRSVPAGFEISMVAAD